MKGLLLIRRRNIRQVKDLNESWGKSGFAIVVGGNCSKIGMHRLWTILESQFEFEVN